jgi:hypothetical protein
MTYQQKMIHAIWAAEKWQAQVVSYEDKALDEAKRIIRSKRPRKTQQLPVPMGPVLVAHIKGVLENDTMYHRAVGNRNAQQTLAQMYGTAALVENTTPKAAATAAGVKPCPMFIRHPPHIYTEYGPDANLEYACPGVMINR